MKTIELSNEEIDMIIDLIDNQCDIIYDKFPHLSEFLQHRINLLSLIKNKLEQATS